MGRLKALLLFDSVSSQEPRPGFTKATVAAWRLALEARGLGDVSINVRITAVRKLAVETADNGLQRPNWPMASPA